MKLPSSVLPFLTPLVFTLALPSPTAATSFVRVEDGVMAEQASVIAEVRVLEVDPSPGAGRPVTDYLVEVERQVKGYPGDWLTVRVGGGLLPDGSGLHIYGAPRFAVGERALLFLNPRADGTWAIAHFLLGAFYLADLEGREIAFRDFSEAREIDLPGLGGARHPEAPRDLALFRGWLGDHLAGNERPRDYFVDPDQLEIPDRLATQDKFTLLLTGNGDGIRWTEFDGGAGVTWRSHQDGQPGLPDTAATVRSALDVWTNDGGSTVRYLWGGTTAASGGFDSFDGVNAFLYENGSEFDEPYSCVFGGVIAAGGPWFGGQTHSHRGMTFRTILGGDVVGNEGVACDMQVPGFGAQVFAHELGHTLGLAHSCGDAESGSCDTVPKTRALMRATIVGPPYRGAFLDSDDREGIAFLYPGVQTPAAPSNLAANALGPGLVELTWQDRSGNESSFEIERRKDGEEFEQIAATGANTSRHEDGTVTSGFAYTYRVRARNGAGASAFTNQASAATPGEFAPADLVATSLSTTEIRLSWRDNALTEEGYEVEIAPGADASEGFLPLSALPADSQEETVAGLDDGTTYTFRVRTTGGIGESSYAVVNATTRCLAGPGTVCLDDGRFKVEVEWRDFSDNTGNARVVPFGSVDSGLLWFFDADNWEMLVKVLDGCGFNQRFWVFAAATTDVEYTLTVTDTASSTTATYTNELGAASPAITDTDAFATCNVAMGGEASGAAAVGGGSTGAAREGAAKAGDCTATATSLCLNNNRFRVEVEWEDFVGNVGDARVVPFGSDDSGLLWFFSPDNWEMLIKVLDGCDFNDHYWVFSAATTNVRYTLKVTDTLTGETKQYVNPLGTSAPALTDTAAFASCP